MTRVLLLRHGATASHRGDVPLTAEGRGQAERAGAALAATPLGRCLLLTSTSRRAAETATLLAQGIRSVDPAATLTGPSTSWGLRNPDLYLGGQRVEMVSGVADFTAQVPGLADADVRSVDFYARFLEAPDRIGHWLHHHSPPGEDRDQVARRLLAFVASLGDLSPAPDTVLCVTHSPVLRALVVHLLGTDPGEPRHLTGLTLELGDGGAVTAAAELTAL